MVQGEAVGPFRVRDVHYDPNEVHPRHGHEDFQISIILRGLVEEDCGGVHYRGSAGDIIVKPRALMHSNAFQNARMISVSALGSALDFPLPAYAWHRTAPATHTAMRLVRRFLSHEDVREDVEYLFATIPSPIMRDSVLARRARRAFDDTFTETSGIQSIAEHLGVHRVYLARVFRLQFGCSPREYVQRLRVRAAASAIASTKRALAEIALDAGFADQAHMSRLFARTMGITPRSFRRLAQT